MEKFLDTVRNHMERLRVSWGSKAGRLQEEMDIGEAEFDAIFGTVSTQTIGEYGTGKIDAETFVSRIGTTLRIGLNVMDLIESIITNYNSDPHFADMISGGEVVTDSTGEELVPSTLSSDHDWIDSVMTEPMIFKTPEEVKEIELLADKIDERIFKMRFNIKKLAEFNGSGHKGLYEAYMRELKDNEEQIREVCWLYFNELKKLYGHAAKEGLCVLLFELERDAE